MSFASLGLCDEILRSLNELGYQEPTQIQAAAIPVILQGRDVMGGAQTGTGKTAGFTLPILQRLKPHASISMSPARHPVRALILTPTRELAIQVEESVKLYSKYIPLRSAVIYGGTPIAVQTKQLMAGVEILVATPGRLLDHIGQKTLSLSQVEVLILDEADRMLDMGFIQDIREIIAKLPPGRQNLLFSATFSADIKKLADSLLQDPVLIEVARRNQTNESVIQYAYMVGSDQKQALLLHLLTNQIKDDQVIVFTRTKQGANRLATQLTRARIQCAALHGDKAQSERIETLDAFKEGKLRVLIATDVAARGLDVDALPFVINYELSSNPEDYVHRIGRTGRAGATGTAISFCSPEEQKYLVEIEKLTKSILERPHLPEALTAVPLPAQPARSERSKSERAERRSRSEQVEKTAERYKPSRLLVADNERSATEVCALLRPFGKAVMTPARTRYASGRHRASGQRSGQEDLPALLRPPSRRP